jgi:hypothetical protein
MIIVNYKYTRYMGSYSPFVRVHVTPSGSSVADICIASFASRVFPEKLKIAIIKPLHKKGNTEEAQNYIPISL